MERLGYEEDRGKWQTRKTIQTRFVNERQADKTDYGIK